MSFLFSFKKTVRVTVKNTVKVRVSSRVKVTVRLVWCLGLGLQFRVRVRIRNLIGGAAGAHISMRSYACARAVERRLFQINVYLLSIVMLHT